MVDSLAMFFGAKKRRVKRSPLRRRRSPVRKVSRSHAVVVVKGRERKLYKGKEGGIFYKTKSGKHYVDAKFIRAHKSSPKRKSRSSPMRRRRSPVRMRRRSPVRMRRRSPVRMRRTRYGYGLGQPSLMGMMGPAGLVPYGPTPVAPLRGKHSVHHM